MESLLSIIAIAALGIGIIGWLWITVAAFSDGEALWGIGCIVISPVCVVYGLLNFQELKVPVLMVIGGFIMRIAIIAIFATSG
ncbi:MAG: hypothetical protein KDB00_21490 [Planctomycetales bacterium]|nr:hypothetical protein [Planctomycetales bacterium]